MSTENNTAAALSASTQTETTNPSAIQLGNEQLVPLLLLLPVVFFIARYRARRRVAALINFSDATLLPTVYPELANHFSRARNYAYLSAAVTALLLLAAFRPQWGFSWREATRRGIDIAVAIDVSESMLAADAPPSRLERARREVLDLLEELRGDRVALVAFAGVAFTEMPLTLDYGAFRMYLSSLSPDLIPVPGSDFKSALERGLESLGVRADENEPVASSQRSRAILLITDGESLEGDFTAVAEKAKRFGVRIYILGVGTSTGAPIPTDKGYKKDKEGRVVITRLNEDLLSKLATDTGGIYVSSLASNADTKTLYEGGIKRVLTDSDLTQTNAKRWNEYYQLPLTISLILLVFGLWGNGLRSGVVFSRRIFSGTKHPEISKSNLPTLLLLVALSPFAISSNCYAEDPEALGAAGKAALESGKFTDADEAFNKARENLPDDFRFALGAGAAQYRLGNFEQAKALFFEAAGKAKDNLSKAAALYNAGNSQVQLNALKDALKSYQQGLALAPEDEEIKSNMRYAKRLIEEQKKKQQKQDKNQDQDKQQQDGQSQDDQSDNSSQNSDSKNDSEEQEQKNTEKEQQQNKGQQEQQQDESKEKSQQQNENKSQDGEKDKADKDQNNNTDQNQSDKDKSEQDSKSEQSSDADKSGEKEDEKDDSKTGEDEKQNQDNSQSGDKERESKVDQKDPNKGEDEDQKPEGVEEKDEEEKDQQDSSGDEDKKDGSASSGKDQKQEEADKNERQLDNILGSIEEKEQTRREYRIKKAVTQLKAEGRKLPEKDW